MHYMAKLFSVRCSIHLGVTHSLKFSLGAFAPVAPGKSAPMELSKPLTGDLTAMHPVLYQRTDAVSYRDILASSVSVSFYT